MENKTKQARHTFVGKSALVLTARGENEAASQIFNYESMREIRIDLVELEVKVLMTYDESYFRVFKITAKDESPEALEVAKKQILKFYNDLLNASMRLTKEEVDAIKKRQEEMIAKAKEDQKH
ncbi:MAG: hypothetical protein DRP42_04410 [Tenericutes bacterium]|nr:MAG: hypothetical protein DRP42_04410 [Mycoplasmatota bacterium]